MKKSFLKSIIAALLIFPAAIFAQDPGSLDLTFATNGKYTYDNGFNDLFTCTAIQDDQKIIAAGISYDAVYNASTNVFRFMPDGSIDTDFATNGIFNFSLNNEANIFSCAIRPNGKIVLVGSTTDYVDYRILIIQLNSDGTLDNSFGDNGVVVQKISILEGYFEDHGLAMTLQNDGKILVAGRSLNSDYFFSPVVVRFTVNGTLDTSFGTNGVASITVDGSDNDFDCITLQDDGKIVVAGHYELGLQYFGMLVARFNSNGTLDPTFANSGVFIESFGNVDDEGFGVAINSEGKIIVTGFSATASFTYSMLLMQLTSSGVLDVSFGNGGTVYSNLADYNVGAAITIQEDDKIIIAGGTGALPPGGDSEMAVWRYNPDGTLDDTFGDEGISFIQFDASYDEALAMALQIDGYIVIVGKARDVQNQNLDFAMARLVNDYAPFHAGFDASPNPVCVGEVVNFEDLSTGNVISYDWSFEGGTPATSTQQNPQITYNSIGNYNVQLIVTDEDLDKDTLLRVNYISVVETPLQAEQPAGETEICTSSIIEYTTGEVLYAEAYDWELTPSTAGVLTATLNSATLEVSNTWVGDFTIAVRAANSCGDGEWSEDLAGTIYKTPEPYDLIGGGEICEGGTGVEIELNDSEAGMNYELYKNEVATGNIVAGTGEAISFGLFTEEGNYTALGFNDNCSTEQYGEVSVIVSSLPAQLTVPVGTDEVCNNEENEYTTTGAQETDNIVWELSPENAGEVSVDGMTAIVMWNMAFEGNASLTVYAENSCGSGPVSETLEILVMASPTPEVTGDDLVCKEEVSIYSTTENAGSTYGWEVVGGTITAGEGTHEITVAWGNTPGMAYAIVNESLELGCSAVDTLSVTIDDCIGIEDNLTGNKARIYPNPAHSILNLEYSADQGEKVFISVYNSMGQLVMQTQELAVGQKQASILNVEQLPKGMYVVTIMTTTKEVWKGKFDRN
ncbi:MAG TPA: T9SS type A sorting domain-containing protein [Bacteroidales bacterium]